VIKVHEALKGTQVEQALALLLIYVKEDAFWDAFADAMDGTDLSHHDILEDDNDIYVHIRFMFMRDLNILIVPYKTRNPFSSVLGYAEGNRVYENTRKLKSLTLAQRVGHLIHEILHLFGYRHEFQGQNTSAAVLLGEVMHKYAEKRIGYNVDYHAG
jgi:hypothetical protein